jgi:ribosome-associated protein
MLQSKDALQEMELLQSRALELGRLLDDHRGGKVLVMDMRNLNYWTDFFIIATVTSSTHLGGLEKHIKNYARENEMEIFRRSRKPGGDVEQNYGEQFLTGNGPAEWSLIDLGGIVIHLMTAGTRSFFELERLWGAAPLIYQSKE